jgi:hypothetical protein
MTYKALLEKLQNLPQDRLNDTVAVYNASTGDFLSVYDSDVSTDVATDIIPADTFYLVVQENEDKAYKQQLMEKLHQATLAYEATDLGEDEGKWSAAWAPWHALWMEAHELCEQDGDWTEFNAIAKGTYHVPCN